MRSVSGAAGSSAVGRRGDCATGHRRDSAWRSTVTAGADALTMTRRRRGVDLASRRSARRASWRTPSTRRARTSSFTSPASRFPPTAAADPGDGVGRERHGAARLLAASRRLRSAGTADPVVLHRRQRRCSTAGRTPERRPIARGREQRPRHDLRGDQGGAGGRSRCRCWRPAGSAWSLHAQLQPLGRRPGGEYLLPSLVARARAMRDAGAGRRAAARERRRCATILHVSDVVSCVSVLLRTRHGRRGRTTSRADAACGATAGRGCLAASGRDAPTFRLIRRSFARPTSRAGRLAREAEATRPGGRPARRTRYDIIDDSATCRKRD